MHDGSSASHQHAAASQSTVPRGYVPVALVAAAVFLVVIVLARTPLEGYVVSQKIEAADDRVGTASPLSVDQVAAWLRSEAVLAASVQQVYPRASLAAQQELIHELQTGLDLQSPTTAAHSGSGEANPSLPSWQVSLRHRDRQHAAQILKQLGDSLVDQLRHLDRAEAQLLVQHSHKSLAQAREEEDSARQSLERVRGEQLALAMKPAPPRPAASQQPEPATGNSNPAWDALQLKFTAAKARLDQLLLVRTPEHPQVIEAQAQLSLLQQQLQQISPTAPPADAESSNAPLPQGPQLREAAAGKSRLTVRLVSSAEQGDAQSMLGQLPQLNANWSSATARRTLAERQASDAQQQWVRGLSAIGWKSSPVWVRSQVGGQVTSHQLLLAGVLAACAGLGTWQLIRLAFRDCSLRSVAQLAENLPLPIVGEIMVTTEFPRRSPERSNKYLLRLSQLSLAVLGAVVFVAAWASATDSNLSAQWSSDPLSTLGQAFDLLHHRWVG